MNSGVQKIVKFSISRRWYCKSVQFLVAEKLEKRSVVRVSGENCSSYLQGLITNDMKHLEENASMYALFLNTKGRVLYDTIIYRSDIADTFYVECESSIVPDLLKHLKMYRVRKKIGIDNYENEYCVWNFCDKDIVENILNQKKEIPHTITPGRIIPCDILNIKNDCETSGNVDKVNVISSRDPRMPSLGCRVLAPKNTDLITVLIKDGKYDISVDKFYKLLRYKLGVGEGVVDLPPGNCFPLEANCDYLHGVSFHKGCYIGQELTARTYHTGVTRKRLMPLEFDKTFEMTDVDLPIKQIEGSSKSIGKLRGVENNLGLGLLRIEEALRENSLQINGVTVKTSKPAWWPSEAPKERQNTG